MAGGVAHDLNNMLSPILGYGELLLDEPEDGADRDTAAREILEAGKRARDLVAQLLAFSRRQPLDVRVIDLNAVAGEFSSFLRRTIREDVRVEYDLAPGPLLIRGDSRQLEQVLLNLSLNAQDALPEGGVLTVRTRAVNLDEVQATHHIGVEAGRYALLVVQDSGEGMDQDTRQRIFEPFFTTKALGKGTGLGLATVYGVVRQHDGEISVESEEGEGGRETGAWSHRPGAAAGWVRRAPGFRRPGVSPDSEGACGTPSPPEPSGTRSERSWMRPRRIEGLFPRSPAEARSWHRICVP